MNSNPPIETIHSATDAQAMNPGTQAAQSLAARAQSRDGSQRTAISMPNTA